MIMINGHESSILCLLIQGRKHYSNHKRDREKILGMLEGDALQIAKAIVGINKRPREEVRIAIEALEKWRKSLRENPKTPRHKRR